MIVFICDKCEKIILDPDLREGLARKKSGEIICPECRQTKKSVDAIACDRCERAISPELLRKGEALVVLGKRGKKGRIYCSRCRGYGERTSRETMDLKYLIATFIIFLGVPLTLGLSLSFSRNWTETKNQPQTSSDTNLKEDILKELRKELQKEYEPSQLDNDSLPEKKKIVQEAQDNRDDPVVVKKQQKPENSYTKLVDAIEKKAIARIEKEFRSGKKIEAIAQLIRSRERAGIPLLIEALDDQDPVVKSMAAKGLGALGGREGVDKLLAAIYDPDPIVRRSIGQALKSLTGQPFINVEDLSGEEAEAIKRLIERTIEKEK